MSLKKWYLKKRGEVTKRASKILDGEDAQANELISQAALRATGNKDIANERAAARIRSTKVGQEIIAETRSQEIASYIKMYWPMVASVAAVILFFSGRMFAGKR